MLSRSESSAPSALIDYFFFNRECIVEITSEDLSEIVTSFQVSYICPRQLGNDKNAEKMGKAKVLPF